MDQEGQVITERIRSGAAVTDALAQEQLVVIDTLWPMEVLSASFRRTMLDVLKALRYGSGLLRSGRTPGLTQ
jgi:nucleoside-triphosphatase THEP1